MSETVRIQPETLNRKHNGESVEIIYLSPLKSEYFHGSKRYMDVFLSLLACVVLSPLFLFIALCIKLNSPGSAIFRQKRTGQFGREFECFKFRTMCAGNHHTDPEGKPVVTKKDDNRITTIGAVLRKTNLDELPQLWNVVRGEMSLIGPRPYPVSEHKYWAGIIPGWNNRSLVKPGISGLAQITGYRGGNLNIDHMSKRFGKDIQYIRGYSFALDVYITFQTLKQMLTGQTNAH